jgi:peptide/nickel transport system substrate-binding protein
MPAGRRLRGVPGSIAAVALVAITVTLTGCGLGTSPSTGVPSGDETRTTIVEDASAAGSGAPTAPPDDARWQKGYLDGGFAPFDAPTRGGTLRAAVDETETCWNGLGGGPGSRALFAFVGRGLYGYPPTVRAPSAQRLRPEVAADFPLVAEDGLTVTVSLRGDLVFADGTPITAAAVKESLEYMLDPRTQCPGGGPLAAGTFDAISGLDEYVGAIQDGDVAGSDSPPDGIVGIEVVGTGSVVFRLDHPDPWFAHALAEPWAILRAPGAPRTADEVPRVLVGPYRIDRFEPGARLTVVRSDRWGDAVRAGMPQAAYENLIDGIDLALAVPPITQLARLREDALDLSLDGSAPGPSDIGVVIDDPALGARTFSTPAETLLYLALRSDRRPLSDERLRRAVNLAIDRRNVVRTVGGAVAAEPWAALLPADLIGDESSLPYRRDRATARRLIKAATPRAPRLRLTSPADGGSVAVAATVARQLEAVGFRVSRTVVTVPDYAAYVADPGADFDLAIAGWGPSFGDASTVLGPLLICGRGDNLGRFCDLDVDVRIDEVAGVALGPSRSAQFAALAADLGREHSPLAVLVQQRRVSLISSRVGNYRWGPVGLVYLSSLYLRS